jgi:hypothetical protein
MESAIIKDQGVLPVEHAVALGARAPFNDAFVSSVDEEQAPLHLTAALGLTESVQVNAIIA